MALDSNNVILFKASHSMNFETLIRKLQKDESSH